MYPWFILQEGVAVNFLGDFIVVHVIIYCFFDYPAFLHRGYMVETFLIDGLGLNEIEEMFFWNHPDLREVAGFACLRFKFEWFKELVLIFVFGFFDGGTNFEDVSESFEDNSLGKVLFA